jgi:hypothetical protein
MRREYRRIPRITTVIAALATALALVAATGAEASAKPHGDTFTVTIPSLQWLAIGKAFVGQSFAQDLKGELCSSPPEPIPKQIGASSIGVKFRVKLSGNQVSKIRRAFSRRGCLGTIKADYESALRAVEFRADPSPPTASTMPVPTTTTAPPTTTLPPPPTTTTEDPAQVATDWEGAHAGALQDLQSDLDDVTNFGNGGDAAGVLAACQQLAADTRTVQGFGPFPIANLQGNWAQSLADFAQAAQAGIRAIQNDDPSQVAAYKQYIKNGISQQQIVTNAVNAMG